jgi:WD40 repeat protein
MRTDPREVFRNADRVPAPDLWPDIVRRPLHPSLRRPIRRITTIVLALALAAGGASVLLVTLGPLGGAGHREPSGSSASPFPEGSITVPRGTVPGGALLFQLGQTAEILPSGSDHSLQLGELRVQELSPDGSQVLAVRGDRLIAIDLSTGSETRLAEVRSDESVLYAEWSPDGRRVAYRLGFGNPTEASKACIVDVSSQVHDCLAGLNDVYTLHWAPVGAHLIVTGPGQQVQSVAIDSGEISTLIPPDGSPTVTGALQQAGYGSPIQYVDPTWSPSGKYVGALANMQGGSAAYVPVVLDAQGRLVAVGKPSADFPGFRGFGWSPLSDVFAYGRADSPNHVNEVRLLDAVSGKDRLLTSVAAGDGHTIRGLAWSPSGQWVAVDIENWSGQGYELPSDLRIVPVEGGGSWREFSFNSGDEAYPLAGWGPA